ncbi:allatostatin-A receptor-like isoform X2 [Asterias amurensis]
MENTSSDTLFTTLSTPQTEYPEITGFNASDKIGVAIYCIIGLCGFIGNLLACIVFWSLRSNRNQVSLLIFTQALADLVTSVLLISFAITRVYRHLMPTEGATGEWLCRFWWSRFVLFYFFAISTFNLTLISLERYVAVVHPLTYSKRFTSRNTKIFVGVIWLFCPVMQYGQSLWGYSAASGTCQTVPSWDAYGQAIFGVLLYLWELVTPICTMGICYLFIVKTLREKERAVRRSKSVTVKPEGRFGSVVKPTRQNSRKGITMTLLILFIIYVICWTPNQTTFVQFNLGGPLDFNGGWYLFTVILAFLNCCVNPFVYAFRLRQFRVRVKGILQCRRKGIARGGESDDEFFRDPASNSSKWSARKEKLGKMFGMKLSDRQGSSVTPSTPQTSPQGTPHATPHATPHGTPHASPRATPVLVKKNSETARNGKNCVH